MSQVKRILGALICLLCLQMSVLHAQGVGINSTGVAADTSAMLDVSSTSKGLLPPRMTSAQRSAISLPATGLVVYQTNGAAGFYYNAGTAGAPNWKRLVDTTSSGGSQWITSGSNIYYSSGHVGIGVSPTITDGVLDVAGRIAVRSGGSLSLSAGLWLNSLDNSFRDAFIGMENDDYVGLYGGPGAGWSFGMNTATGDVKVLGKLGIGTSTPNAPLTFPPTLTHKITLYPGTTGDAGFGMAGNRLQIYSDNPNADVAIGYDAAGTFNERFAVKPNGAVAVNGNTGSTGQVLQSNGSGGAATWASSTNSLYNNTYQAIGGSMILTEASPETPMPGMSQTFTVNSTAKVLVTFSISVQGLNCAFCGESSFALSCYCDNAQRNFTLWEVRNGEYSTAVSTLMITVGPGTHTVDMRAGSVTGPDVQFGARGFSVMTVQIMQQ